MLPNRDAHNTEIHSWVSCCLGGTDGSRAYTSTLVSAKTLTVPQRWWISSRPGKEPSPDPSGAGPRLR